MTLDTQMSSLSTSLDYPPVQTRRLQPMMHAHRHINIHRGKWVPRNSLSSNYVAHTRYSFFSMISR